MNVIKKEGLAMKRILRVNFLCLFVICFTLFFAVSSFASAVTIKGSTRAYMYGLFYSEINCNIKPTGQVRLEFKFKNIDMKTRKKIAKIVWNETA